MAVRGMLRIVVLCCAGVLPGMPWADAAASDDARLAARRAEFKAAEAALARGDLSRFQAYKTALKSYPLYPYLEYEQLRRQLSSADSAQIRQFLNRYADTPLAEQLRATWLERLARGSRWTEYLEFHQPGGSIKQRCQALQALIETGRREQALAQVEPIWLQGESLPSACDPVFSAWREQGRLTPELLWGRIELAMERSDLRLVRYLGRMLQAGEQPRLELWLDVHRHPERILRDADFQEAYPQRPRILLHGLQRLARKDPAQALDAWRQLAARYDFSAEQQAVAERALALALLRDGRPELFGALADLKRTARDAVVIEARLRAALADGDWRQVLEGVASLPDEERDSPRWRYWKARALESQGEADQAKALYAELRGDRDYYGFLAADRVGARYRLGNAPVTVAETDIRTLAHLPGARRARELFALDRLVSARREWQNLLDGLSAAELLAAAKLADSWGWHDRAIFALARAGYWDDLDLRFPLEHRDRVERVAAEQGLDSAWVFAMVRQESAFMTDAHSSKGALGLMQLMPQTARQVARHLRDRSPKADDLLRPATNIRYGTTYLKQVFEDLDRNPVLAIAAYNAGPHRVRSWMPECTLPADVWIETVPFRETRTYLTRVLTYTAIYEDRLGRTPTRLTQRMRPVGECGENKLPDRLAAAASKA